MYNCVTELELWFVSFWNDNVDLARSFRQLTKGHVYTGIQNN